MRAILPPDILPANETYVGFIDKSGGLQWMIRPFTCHVPRSQSVQFLLNTRRELF
jgi:hypothetical protein